MDSKINCYVASKGDKQTNKQTSKQASNVLSPLGTLNIKFILTKKIYFYKEERDRESERDGKKNFWQMLRTFTIFQV